MTELRHCIPLNDEREHAIAVDCWCNPHTDKDEPRVWIHVAADMRDAYEQIIGEGLPGKQWAQFVEILS